MPGRRLQIAGMGEKGGEIDIPSKGEKGATKLITVFILAGDCREGPAGLYSRHAEKRDSRNPERMEMDMGHPGPT